MSSDGLDRDTIRFFHKRAKELRSPDESVIPTELLAAISECKARLPPGSTFLDIGCGYGKYAGLATSFGMPYIGIDPAEGQLRLAREAHPDLTFHIGGLLDTQHLLGTIQQPVLFLLISVITFISRDDVKRGFRILRDTIPTGSIGIIVFMENPDDHILSHDVYSSFPEGYRVRLTGWSIPDVGKLCRESGFKVDEYFRTGEEYECYGQLIVTAI